MQYWKNKKQKIEKKKIIKIQKITKQTTNVEKWETKNMEKYKTNGRN